MDDNFYDDFGRNPNALRPDRDAAMDEFRREFDATPSEVHERHREEAAPFLQSNIGQDVFLNDKSAITLGDDPEALKSIDKALAADAKLAAEQAAAQLPSDASGQHPGGAPFGTPGANPSMDDMLKKQGAPKPSELESTLANIRLNGDRQRRLVITGDPEIAARFYAKLADRKQVYYQGGVPMITLSHDKAIKVLLETAREVEGAKAVHALSLNAERDGGGIIGSAKAAVLNKMGFRQHQIDVVVVGKEATVKSKLEELGGFVRELDTQKLATGGADAVREGKLVPPEDGPTQLKATDKLYTVLDVAVSKVTAHRAERDAQLSEKRDMDSKDTAEKIAKAKEKADPTAISHQAVKVAKELDLQLSDKDLLHLHTKNQSGAERILQQARSLSDPTKPELQTLPDADRQKAIVQLASLVAKVDSKEFDREGYKLSATVNRPGKEGTSSIREKVDAYVAMEAKRDPTFAEKAQATLQDLTDRKMLSEEQAAHVMQKLTEAVAQAHPAKTQEAATTAASAESGKAQEGTAETAANTGSAPAQDGAQATTQESTKTESTSGNSHASTESQSGTAHTESAGKSDAATQEPVKAQAELFPATESRAATDAQTATQGAAQSSTEGVNAPRTTIPDLAAQSASKQGDSAASHNAAEASAVSSNSATAAPITLRDRIETMAKEGPAALTEKKADELVTALDGIRSKPLASLDSRTGHEPSQTLANAKALLAEVQTGRFGAELQARAKDLAEPMQRWSGQDAARYDKAAALAPIAGRPAETIERPAATTHNSNSSHSATTGPASTTTASAANQSQQSTSAEQAAKEQSAQRVWETESAGAKLSQLMSNPAGSFTNRDKTWNETNIQRAAQEVMRIDPDSVSQLSSAQRTKIAAYSAWVAENASNGKLPGFSSEEGKAQASQLVERAAALIGKMDNGAALTSDVEKTLTKADRMVEAKAELQKSAAFTSEASRETVSRGAISPAAAKALSTDMVHSVFHQKEVREAQVKYLLKNAGNLTPDSIKSLPPQDQAKTAVAISHLAQSVREGALGEFSKLPSGVQKNVLAAGQAGDNLLATLHKDPAMRVELNQAYNELHGRGTSASSGTNASASHGTSSTTHRSADSAAAKPSAESSGASKTESAGVQKSEGRSLDR